MYKQVIVSFVHLDQCVGFETVTSEACSTVLPYSQTFFPNRAFPRVEDAKLIGDNLALIKNCDPNAFGFLCGMLLPECPAATTTGIGRAPCQSYCQQIASSPICSQFFAIAGIDGGTYCDLLPSYPVEGDHNFCTYVLPSTIGPRKL